VGNDASAAACEKPYDDLEAPGFACHDMNIDRDSESLPNDHNYQVKNRN
jgi:hypothetical protein